MNQFTAIKEIEKELARAVQKFPEFPDDPIHAAGIVNEEAGELMKAALQFTYENGTIKELREEAIQTGAMAIRFLMHLYYLETNCSEQTKTILAEK